MTSRINTMFSIPMLYCMVAQQNAWPEATAYDGLYLAVPDATKVHECARGADVAREPISLDSLPDWPD
jgi:hypothetical protein